MVRRLLPATVTALLLFASALAASVLVCLTATGVTTLARGFATSWPLVHRHDCRIHLHGRRPALRAFQHGEILDVLPAEDNEVVDLARGWDIRDLAPLGSKCFHRLQGDGGLLRIDARLPTR